MAHPARKASVGRLLGALDAHVPVVWDTGRPSLNAEKRWLNGKRAWESADTSADFHLVIQDDALPCVDLLESLPWVLENAPGPGPVSLYMGARSGRADVHRLIKRAENQQAAFIGLPLLGWGVAFAVATNEIGDMLAVCDASNGQPYDLRIGKYFRDIRHVPTWYTFPSLVDHDTGQRSLVGHVGSHRRAYKALRGSACDVDWGAGFVEDERAPGARKRR